MNARGMRVKVRAVNTAVFAVMGIVGIVVSILWLSHGTSADDSLVARWKFDEGSGAVAVDSSGNGHDGTVTNASYSATVPDVSYSNPYSMEFNPANSGRIVSTNLQLNNYTQFTMSGWAYPTAANSRASWFGQNDLFEFGFTDGDTLFCYTAKGEASWDFNPGTFLNHWHNITCLATDTELIIYIDGVNVASTSIEPGSFGSSGDHFSIGAGAVDGGTTGPFSGYIDDVRVYSRGLSPEEMTSIGSGDAAPGDSTVPTVSALSPANGSYDAAVGTSLTMTFQDFTDFIGTGEGMIHLYKAADNSLVESIAADDATRVSVSGGTVTINPTSDLQMGAKYYVEVDADAFYDGGDDTKYFAGINDTTTWVFTTLGDGPAGVGSGLRLWLDASKGVKSDGDDAPDGWGVDTWEDQSTSGRDAVRESTPAVYRANGLNFNPTLDFYSSNYNVNTTGLADGTDDRSIFVVASTDSNGWRYVLGAGSGPGSERGFDFGFNAGTSQVFITNHNSANANTSSWLPYGTARLAYGAVSSSSFSIAVNGETPVGGIGTGLVNTAFNGPLNIGANSADYEYWDGNISEVIFYNRVVSSEERQRITSYLALKYGFSIDQTTPQSYLASGSALMWNKDAPGASTYNNGLFGIGRDDSSGLSQVKSVGQAATNIITMEAVDEGTNTTPNYHDMDNLEFLVVGDNNGSATWTTTGAPTGYKLLQRQWAKQERGDVGAVNLSFNVDDSDLNVPASEDGQYALVYDTDNDGSLADETPMVLTNTGGSNWARDLDFGAGSIFTLASVDKPKATFVTPSDGATGVARNTNLVVTFDRTVTAAEGTIEIRKYNDDSLVEAIPATDARVSGSGTSSITINPGALLSNYTRYYVVIDTDTFVDSGDQYYAGQSDKNAWDFTTADDIAPIDPGKPSASSPTTDMSPTVSWTASTDNGAGLKDPAYTLEWSTSATFASVIGSSTTNGTSLAPTLTEGTWYFRVKAIDAADNIATSAISDPVIIDTTPPSKPGKPNPGTLWSGDNTPRYDWTASTDSGSGLATIAYAVQWSQDVGFSGLGGQAGVTDNYYEIPDNLAMTDSTWYFRVKAIDAAGNESAWSDYVTIYIDTVMPIISDIAATNGASVGKQVITWKTDKDTSSKVLYGPTSSLGTATAEVDTSTRVQNHSVTLTNLVPCSIYHYEVTSKDIAGNTATSGDQTFISAGCAGAASVVTHATAPITTSGGGNVGLDTITVHVPSGFAAMSADFQIKKIDHDPALGAIGSPAGMLLAGTKVYDIKALVDGTTALTSFSKPITITLHYDKADVATLAELSLAIYRWDDGTGWTKLTNCSVDTTANTVTCTTTHFSTFALYGNAKIMATGSVAEAPDQQVTSDGRNTTASFAKVATDTGRQSSKSTSKELGLAIQWWWVVSLVVVCGFWLFVIARRRRKKDDEQPREV